MTETEIANLALSHIGGKSLTNVDTDSTPQAITCRKWFDLARDEALSGHAWNFATKRARLTLTWTDLSGVALADNGAGLIRVTATAHGLTSGQRIHIQDVEGAPAANGTWYVTRINDNAFDLQDSVFSGSHTSGTGEWILAPLFGWSYQHSLPSGCLKITSVNGLEANEQDSIPYAIEGTKMLCDADVVELRYVESVSTTTEWSNPFIVAFAYLLASYIAQDLTGPGGKAVETRQLYEKMINPKSMSQDSRNGKGRVIDPTYDSRTVRARQGFA